MLFNRLNKVKAIISTLLGVKTTVNGNIVFSGGLRIDGTVIGNIKELTDTPSTLIIGEHGIVEGCIEVSSIVINGKVIGKVHANQFVELQPKAHVEGDILYRSIEIDVGATVDGKLVHTRDNPVGLSADGAVIDT